MKNANGGGVLSPKRLHLITKVHHSSSICVDGLLKNQIICKQFLSVLHGQIMAY
jgi:hypothetical protein